MPVVGKEWTVCRRSKLMIFFNGKMPLAQKQKTAWQYSLKTMMVKENDGCYPKKLMGEFGVDCVRESGIDESTSGFRT